MMAEKVGAARWVQAPKDFISSRLRLQLWLLSGAEKHGGEAFSLIYAGLEPQKFYLANRAFQPGWNEKYLGREWVWLVQPRARRENPRADLLVFELDKGKERFFSPQGALRSPVWVRMDLWLDPAGYSSQVRARYKDMRRRIRKWGFSCTFSRSEADFDDFYFNMYVPSARKRHGVSALVHGHADLKRVFLRKGELALLHREGKVVASSLIDYSADEPHLLYAGVRDGSETFTKMGALHVLYHFKITKLRETLQAKKVNLGHCRSFFGDAVLRYKLELGAHIARGYYEPGGCLYFRLLRDTGALRRFLHENPFVRLDRGNAFSAAVFSDECFPPEALDEALEERCCRGLPEVTVYLFGQNARRGQVRTPAGRTVDYLPALRLFPPADPHVIMSAT